VVQRDRASTPRSHWVKWVACVVCALLFLRNFSGVDLERTGQLVVQGGPWLLFAAAPFALAQALDTEAWRRVLSRLAVKVRLHELYPLRVAMEAMTVSMPAGVVVAESVAPRMLQRALGVPPAATVAAAGARRWLTMRAHAAYVAIGAAAAFVTFRAHEGALPWLRYAPFVVLGSALLPLGASLAVSLTLTTGSRATHVYDWLSRAPLPPLQRWLRCRREAFTETDAGLLALARSGESFLLATGLLVGAWLLESVEAFVLLSMVGAHLSFAEVLAFEAGLSVLRSLWFFAPAGLGALDLGYMTVLHALGVPDAAAVGAAFLVLKRGRELLWVAMGYAWMAFGLNDRRAATRRSWAHGFAHDATVALGPSGD